MGASNHHRLLRGLRELFSLYGVLMVHLISVSFFVTIFLWIIEMERRSVQDCIFSDC